MPTGYPADGPQPYAPAERTRDTRIFLGMSGLNYYDISCRILTLAENACIVADSGGKHRIVKWQDLSFASEAVARQNPGAVVVLKIRKWS